jgi:Ca2+-transporting ATPase
MSVLSAPVLPYQQTADEVLQDFRADPQKGLSQAESEARRQQYGSNELTPEKPVPAWKKFLAQFADTLVLLLLLATAISAALWAYEREAPLPYEAIAIASVVLLNAIIGYVQEGRAESAVAALKQMTAARAQVIRDGERQSVLAAELVPGDIILIEEGDTVPADARLLETTALQTAEAALTGESLPVSKQVESVAGDAALGDRQNMVFSGTAVTYGRGRAVVVATGMATEMGRIAGMLKAATQETTPLQRELDRVGKVLGAVVVAIAVVMTITIVLVEHVRGLSALLEVLILGVALAVAAVPEGLPAVVTAVLSVGVERMARRNAVVRHLAAVETLGSADIIASDKTGTLTKNEMTVREVVTASGHVHFGGTGYDPSGEITVNGNEAPAGPLQVELQRVLTIADRANNAVLQQESNRWIIRGDPTEGALIVAARKSGLDSQVLETRFERVGEVPFSSARKLMSTIHSDPEDGARLQVFTKGAPDVLLTRCSEELVTGDLIQLTDERRNAFRRSNEELAARGLRTIGVGFRSISRSDFEAQQANESLEQKLVFAGMIGIIDPAREEAKDAVAVARAAGIRVMMITGDHPKTAAVIARELGITADSRAVTGAELEKMSDAELQQVVNEISVYARVNPEHKLRIVKALQSNRAIVAMTGDGVNDAPALKTADIGIAMGITGTDVSKQAADMVLADDNFATIVAAVEKGRAIFSNIRKFLRYLLSSNMGEVMTMFFGVVLGNAIGLKAKGSAVVLPLLPAHLLWINLVTDGAPALALGVDPDDAQIMQNPPRPKTESVITRRMWAGIFFVAIVMAAGTLYVLDVSLPEGMVNGTGSMRYAQTMAFTTLMMFQVFNVFNARSDERSAFHRFFSNRWLWAGVGLSIALQFAVLYTPFLQQAFSTVALSRGDWARCTLVASSVLWMRELSKVVSRFFHRTRPV